jgi:hypothetical protein
MGVLKRVTRAIVKVGEGRGFVVAGDDHRRYVITAAHCLPHLPPALSFSSSAECTCKACLFDDGDAPNAFALPPDNIVFPDGRDGTVLLGINLIESEWHRYDDPTVYRVPGQSVWIISAHEFAHILQYKNGMTPDGPWQMEPHADFMAGWCLGRQQAEYRVEPKYIELLVKSLFEKGDTGFYDRDHHGEPEFRAAMVLAGLDAFKLDVKAAFDKGRKMADLK